VVPPINKAISTTAPSRGRLFLFPSASNLLIAAISFLIFFTKTFVTSPVQAANDPLRFSDQPQERDIKYPPWFKNSFLDLRQDLDQALASGKVGVMVFFGQKNCGYCAAFVNNNLEQEDISIYIQRNFDVIYLDIWGQRDVVDLDGDSFTEREYSILHNTNFTPSMMFLVAGRKNALLLRGYHGPYRFRAALRYVAEGFYKNLSFPDYVERADTSEKFEQGELNERDFFTRPPYILSRSQIAADRPLLVMFESRDCHACDVMHSDPLRNPGVLERLKAFEVVQLDMQRETPLITPLGDHTNARNWAHRLGIAFAPTLVFFDEHGREIIRLDSVTKVVRMGRVLDYVLEHGYLHGNYQQWRERKRHKNHQSKPVG